MSTFRKIFLLALSLAATACTTLQTERFQNADGMLSALLGWPGPNALPVEKVSTDRGRVVTAHAVRVGQTLRVSGLLSKASLAESPRGSHVDILLRDREGKVTAAAAVKYFREPLQAPSSRYGPRYSSYVTRLPFPAREGSTVRVIFHDAPLAQCEFGPGY